MAKTIKYFLLNPKTGDNLIRDLKPNQIAEVVRDGYTTLIPLKTAQELQNRL